MERLKGQVTIVTGSGQGMGLAIGHACAGEGAKIVVVDINDQTIGSAVEEIRKKNGADVMGIKIDITKPSDVETGMRKVLEAWGRIDCLVNCAGGALNTPYKLEEIEEKHWDLVVDVNMKGTFLCCQYAIPAMVKQGKGAIVNISALAGHWRASLAGVQYSAAKAGVEGITRQLAYDFGPLGVRINAVAPTVSMTSERMQGLWDARSEEEKQKVYSQIPLRRLSKVEEITAAIVFLLSDEASYITGITLDVCGGRYLR